MNNAGISGSELSDAEKIVSDVSEKIGEESGTAAGWAQSVVSRLSSRLKKTGAHLQEQTERPALERPATDRAEESLDRAGEQIGLFAAAVGHRVRRSVALAREEAEDVLAEAQSLRYKDR